MRTINKWSWAFAAKIRGQVDGGSFCSAPVIEVDVELKRVKVKGGEVFQLGERDPEDSKPLEEIAALVAERRSGGVR